MKTIVSTFCWPPFFSGYWGASFEGEEETVQRGTGQTEDEAIEELLALYGDDQEHVLLNDTGAA